MSRRAVAVHVLLLMASAAFVAAPLLDVCHHPIGHHDHDHRLGAPVAHDHHARPEVAGASASPALGADESPAAHPHESHLACSGVAALGRRAELRLGAVTAFVSPGSPDIAPRLALGPTTPPP